MKLDSKYEFFTPLLRVGGRLSAKFIDTPIWKLFLNF